MGMEGFIDVSGCLMCAVSATRLANTTANRSEQTPQLDTGAAPSALCHKPERAVQDFEHFSARWWAKSVFLQFFRHRCAEFCLFECTTVGREGNGGEERAEDG